MSDIVSPLLQWLNTHPQFAGLVTFLISAGESVAIIGTIIPGSITMTALGALAGAGVIPLWGTVFWAIFGAIVGDGISYWFGYYFKDRLPLIWPFYRYPGLLKSGEKFFLKYGGMSVFIGRFVGPVRALVPMVAGMLGMKPWKFTVANITSAILWAPAYMFPGILLGIASLELPPDIAMHVILVLLLIILFVMLCLWLIYKSLQLIHSQTTHLQNEIWHRLKHSRYLSKTTILLKHHDPNKTYGQLTLAIYFFFGLVLLCSLFAYVLLRGANHIMMNEAIFHLFREIRNIKTDTILIGITLLGQKQVILPAILLVSAWVMLCKRWHTAIHILILTILTSGSVYILKHLLKNPRPWGIHSNMGTYSMPSGHAALATAIYMGLAFLIASSLPAAKRKYIYAMGILLALLVGISRLYLGAHWFTDVLSGWLLGAELLILMIISYERKADKPLPLLPFIFVTLASLTLTFSIYFYTHLNQLKQAYTQLDQPVKIITLSNWWNNKGPLLPAYQASLFGFPTQKINIQWSGNLDQIRQSLLKAGWAKPPARDWVSTLHRIADISSTEYLPLVSPQYLDQPPTLILTRNLGAEPSLLVIRLWNASRVIKESQSPLWVGVVSLVPRPYSWIFKPHPGEIEIHPSLVFPHKMNQEWKWKTIIFHNGKNNHGQTVILLIRPFTS